MAKTNCEVIIEMASGTFRGQGETVPEAMLAVPLDFMGIKYKGTIKIIKDGKTTERLFMMPQLRRMFGTKTARIHWAHQIEKFLK